MILIVDPVSMHRRMSYMNLEYGSARYESFIAQWLEH